MLKHKNLRNIGVATSFGKITFDSEGFSDDLTEEQQKELGRLHNFEYLSEEDLKEVEEEVEEVEEVEEEVEEYLTEMEELEEELEETEEVEEYLEEMDELEEELEETEVKEYGDITLAKIKEELTDLGVDYNEKGTKKELYEVYTEELTK